METLLGAAPEGALSGSYRTANGAEIDLVLDIPGRHRRWAIEGKRSSAPRRSHGFTAARRDLDAERAFVVYGGEDRFPMGPEVEAIGLLEMAALLRDP